MSKERSPRCCLDCGRETRSKDQICVKCRLGGSHVREEWGRPKLPKVDGGADVKG